MSTPYPRDLVGYAGRPPHPHWPGEARIAVNFVMNYEEGSEYNVHDDGFSEGTLTESGATNYGVKGRDLAAEGMFEYGSRVGFWRVLRLFKERGLPLTVFGCALALERNPAVAAAIKEAGFDVCSHGWRWVKHYELTEEQEREHIRLAIASMQKTLGERPLGWYCRYGPSVNTRRLLVEEGGFLYDSDTYNDELPYWVRVNDRPHLVVPYSLTANDSKFGSRRLLHRQRLLHVREGRLRRALPRGPDAAQDDVARPAPAAHRPPVARRRPRARAGLHRRPPGGVVHAAHRHRPALDRHASGALALTEPEHRRPIMGKLDGKVALISGGARGQGAAEAETFVKEGARVVFGDIRDDEGKKVEAAIRARGGDAVYVHLDVTSETDWQAAVQTTTSRYGKLDILINNAAIVIPRVPIEERTVAEWDRVMAVNAKGVFLGTKHAIPAMRRAGGGSIVNISSVAGIGQSLHQEPAYAASKGAIRIFTKVTASQHAKDGIRCNSVHPGPVDTEMFHSALSDKEAMQRRLDRVPLRRMGTVAEIVTAVLYLASDESSYMTGSELVIDGGALAQ